MSPSFAVDSLFDTGQTLYIGGAFDTIGGLLRGRVAALDKATEALTPSNPNADGIVRAFLVQNGKVYLGGDFTMVGAQAPNCLAVVDAVTGAVIGN